MSINEWWSGDSGERFWVETTNRDEGGSKLIAPQLNDAGFGRVLTALESDNLLELALKALDGQQAIHLIPLHCLRIDDE